MAKLKIVIAGAPVLREVAQPVERIDKKLQRLLRDMAETMYAADGVGLAAPQVGVSKRVVVIDVGEGLYELINPEIVKREGKVLGSEGCLSVPDYEGEVERSEYANSPTKPVNACCFPQVVCWLSAFSMSWTIWTAFCSSTRLKPFRLSRRKIPRML